MSEIHTRVNRGKQRAPRRPGCKATGNQASVEIHVKCYYAPLIPVLIFTHRKFEKRNVSQGQDTSVPRFPGQNAIFKALESTLS